MSRKIFPDGDVTWEVYLTWERTRLICRRVVRYIMYGIPVKTPKAMVCRGKNLLPQYVRLWKRRQVPNFLMERGRRCGWLPVFMSKTLRMARKTVLRFWKE